MKFHFLPWMLIGQKYATVCAFSYIDAIGNGPKQSHTASSGPQKKDYSPSGGSWKTSNPIDGGQTSAGGSWPDSTFNDPDTSSPPTEHIAYYMDNLSPNSGEKRSSFIYQGPSKTSNPVPQSPTSYLDVVASASAAFSSSDATTNSQPTTESSTTYMDYLSPLVAAERSSYVYTGPSGTSEPAPQSSSYLDMVSSSAADLSESSGSYMEHLSPSGTKKDSYIYQGPSTSSKPAQQSSYLDNVSSAFSSLAENVSSAVSAAFAGPESSNNAFESSGSYMGNLSPPGTMKKDSYIYQGPSKSSKPAGQPSYLDNVPTAFQSPASTDVAVESSGSYMDHLSPPSTMKRESYIYQGPSESSQPSQVSSYLDSVPAATSPGEPAVSSQAVESSGSYMDNLSPPSSMKRESYIYQGPSESSQPAQQSSYLDNVASASAVESSGSYMDHLSPTSGTMKRESYIYQGPSDSSQPAQQSSYLDNVASASAVESSGSYMDHLSPTSGTMKRESYIYQGPSESSQPAQQSSYLDNVASSSAAFTAPAAPASDVSTGPYMDHLSPPSTMKRDSYIYQGPSQSSQPAQQSSYLDNVASSPADFAAPAGAASPGPYMDHLTPPSTMKRDSYIYQGPSQSSKPAQQSSYLDNVASSPADFTAPAGAASSGPYMDHLTPPSNMKRDSYIYQGPSQSSKPAQQSSYLDNVASSPAEFAAPQAPAGAASPGPYMDHLSPPSNMKRESYIYQGPSQGSKPAQQSSYLDNVASSSAPSTAKKDSYIYQGPSKSSKPAQLSSYLDNVSSSAAGGFAPPPVADVVPPPPQSVESSGSYMDHLSPPSTMKRDSYIYTGPSTKTYASSGQSYASSGQSGTSTQATESTGSAAVPVADASGSYMDNLSPPGTMMKKDSYIYSGPSKISQPAPAQSSSYLDNVSSSSGAPASTFGEQVTPANGGSYMDALSPPSTMKKESYIYSPQKGGPATASSSGSSYLESLPAEGSLNSFAPSTENPEVNDHESRALPENDMQQGKRLVRFQKAIPEEMKVKKRRFVPFENRRLQLSGIDKIQTKPAGWYSVPPDPIGKP